MKRILLAAFLWAGSLFPAAAGVPCTLPFTLTNGTIADATQVMANYNALVTCLQSAAAAGNNSDITALLGLTTPLSPTFGGSPFYLGATSSGTNALVVSSTTPNTFSLLTGKTVVFLAGGTNGPGGTTLNVAGTGIVNLYRASQTGPVALIGGEIQAGQIVLATYDGTQYEMVPQASYASLIATNQTVTGGANATPYDIGSLSGGTTYTPNCANGPLQRVNNAGNFTLAIPSFDSSCQILVTNVSGAGTITFSGQWSAGVNTGDTVDTTNGHHFILSIDRITNSTGTVVATYFWKATQ